MPYTVLIDTNAVRSPVTDCKGDCDVLIFFLVFVPAHARSASPAGFVKALFLTALFLTAPSLTTARPTEGLFNEQLPGGYLAADLCDAQGQPLTNTSPLDGQGFYTMTGTQHRTITTTYPADMINAGLAAWPNGYQSSWLGAAYPVYLNAYPDPDPDTLYHGLGSNAGIDEAHEAEALNGYDSSSYTYSLYDANGVSHTGLVNGSVTVDVTGHLVSYLKVTWSPSDPDNPAPMPDHLTLLLRTNVSADVLIDPGTSLQSDGLWAQATASDGSPFGETASAGIGLDDGGTGMGLSGTPLVTGYHLVRSAIDPVTHIATVSLDGTMHYTASNSVPYQIISGDPEAGGETVTNGPTRAYAASGVSGGVNLDTREVEITCPEVEAPISYWKSYVDSAHQDGKWPNVRDVGTGNISVDTVVTRAAGDYVASASPAGDRFIGQASNFSHPYYTWAFQGVDGQLGLYAPHYLGVESDQFQEILLNLYFGSSLDGFPKFSQLQLTVRDGHGNATAATTYGVHWHLPAENWKLISSVPTTNRLYPDLATDADGSTEIEPNRTVNYSIPTPEIDVAGPLLKTTSVFLAGAGAAAPLILPEAIATGPIGIATATALAGGSVLAAFLVPPDPGKDVGHTSYKDYIYAVNQQKIVDDTGQGVQRFDPSNVDAALKNFAMLQAKYPAPENWEDHWEEDPMFSQSNGSKMRVKAQCGRQREINSYIGDAYNQQGYNGQTTNTQTRDKDVFYVETWSFTGSTGPQGQP